MNCLMCNKTMALRRNINMETHAIVFKYFHCEKCRDEYDLDGNQIIIKGNEYIYKKNVLDPMI